jgi:hypothetical protein
MTTIEQVAALVMQINNLKARIECAEEGSLTWEEEWQLKHLQNQLEQIAYKGGISYGRRKSIHYPR